MTRQHLCTHHRLFSFFWFFLGIHKCCSLIRPTQGAASLMPPQSQKPQPAQFQTNKLSVTQACQSPKQLYAMLKLPGSPGPGSPGCLSSQYVGTCRMQAASHQKLNHTRLHMQTPLPHMQ
jgi:hypothetical protein